MAKTRKKTSPAQRDAARAASKKEKKAKESPEKVGPKPHVWGKTGWCSHDLASTNIVKNHLNCKPVVETPSVIMHCPCLCHAPGVMEVVREYELTLDSKCPVCHTAGRPIKTKAGKKMWKCDQKHKWPRKGK